MNVTNFSLLRVGEHPTVVKTIVTEFTTMTVLPIKLQLYSVLYTGGMLNLEDTAIPLTVTSLSYHCKRD